MGRLAETGCRNPTLRALLKSCSSSSSSHFLFCLLKTMILFECHKLEENTHHIPSFSQGGSERIRDLSEGTQCLDDGTGMRIQTPRFPPHRLKPLRSLAFPLPCVLPVVSAHVGYGKSTENFSRCCIPISLLEQKEKRT